MTSNESWRRYLETSAALSQVTLNHAEDIARGLFSPSDDERDRAWRELDQLAQLGRVMGEQLAELARDELSRQLKTIGFGGLEQLLDRMADLFADSPEPSAEPGGRDGSYVDAPSEVEGSRSGSESVSTPPLAGKEPIGSGAKKHKGAKSKAAGEKQHKNHKKPKKHTDKKHQHHKKEEREAGRSSTLSPTPPLDSSATP